MTTKKKSTEKVPVVAEVPEPEPLPRTTYEASLPSDVTAGGHLRHEGSSKFFDLSGGGFALVGFIAPDDSVTVTVFKR